MAKVKAISKGYFGGVIREIGEVFEWPEKIKLGKWVKPLDGKAEAEAEDAKPAEDGGKAEDSGKAGKGRGRKAKPETVDAPTAEPFADNGEPEVAQGNDATEALGGSRPDWLPPDTPHTAPVMADE